MRAPPHCLGLPPGRARLWLFAAALGLCLSPHRPALAASNLAISDLTIMVEDASEPFSRADGSGYANDLVRAAFAAAGVRVQFNVVPYARCKEALKRATVPACFAMSWSRDLEDTGIVFSREPLFEVRADVFQKRAAARPLRALTDLKRGATVGVINGYEYPRQIASLEQKGVALQRGMDDGANLRMLAHDRLDAVILMTSELDDIGRRLDRGEARRDVRFAFRSGLMQSYIAFNLRNPQGKMARDAFEGGYRSTIFRHEKDRIRRRWMTITRAP
jgi:hypothetical protein